IWHAQHCAAVFEATPPAVARSVPRSRDREHLACQVGPASSRLGVEPRMAAEMCLNLHRSPDLQSTQASREGLEAPRWSSQACDRPAQAPGRWAAACGAGATGFRLALDIRQISGILCLGTE